MEKANILWMTRVPIKTDQTADETSKERAMTQRTIEQMIEFLSMRITAGMMTAGYYRGDAMAVEFVDMNMAIRAALAEKQGVRLPERDTTKPAEQQGLFRKFEVQRVDGTDAIGGKHHG